MEAPEIEANLHLSWDGNGPTKIAKVDRAYGDKLHGHRPVDDRHSIRRVADDKLIRSADITSKPSRLNDRQFDAHHSLGHLHGRIGTSFGLAADRSRFAQVQINENNADPGQQRSDDRGGEHGPRGIRHVFLRIQIVLVVLAFLITAIGGAKGAQHLVSRVDARRSRWQLDVAILLGSVWVLAVACLGGIAIAVLTRDPNAIYRLFWRGESFAAWLLSVRQVWLGW